MTQPGRITLHQSLAGAALAAGGYIGFFQLNDWLFHSIQVSEHISWIFLSCPCPEKLSSSAGAAKRDVSMAARQTSTAPWVRLGHIISF